MNKNENVSAVRLQELTRILNSYQYEYYVLAKPSVSDLDYDRLYDELLSIEREYPDLALPDSPSQRVGSDLSQDLPEVEHRIPVLSLDKAYSIEDIYIWVNKNINNTGENLSFVLEEKIDGTSVVLYYIDGLLEKAVTRGNGLAGNDVTGNIKTIRSVPIRLPEPVTVSVRTEVFLPLDKFSEINTGMDVPYANPRNLASGTLRRVKSSKVAEVPLDLFVYEGYFEDDYNSHIEILHRLRQLNFKLNPNISFFADDMSSYNDILGLYPEWHKGDLSSIRNVITDETKNRGNLNYDIDGLVLKVNETRVREKLGYTGHHPRWAMAFKFESPEGVTEIWKIDIQVGRTGRITPVARVKPVDISGSTVSNVTLHNQEYINILEAAVGDTVVISKRGDIIPAVERVIESNTDGNKTYKIPKNCPVCSSKLTREGAHHFCSNPDCPQQVKGRIHFFASRNNMDIDNLGPETLNVLIENNLIRDIQDIYSFNPGELSGVPGFGEKKIRLIEEGILKSKEQPFHIVLQSLGIPEIGQNVIELLIKAGYRDIDSLLDAAEKGNIMPFTSIHGIGDKTAMTLISELSDYRVISKINRLKEHGLQFSLRDNNLPHKIDVEKIFSGETWCVTGSFDDFKPREKAIEEIKRRGGKVTASVTSNTTRLLAGENAGSKLEKAETLGVEILSEKDFLKLIS